MKKSQQSSGANTPMENFELAKSQEHIIIEIVEYVPNAIISRTIIKKITGNVTAMSFSEGEELSEKTSPFDTYIQIIDGVADITIDKRTLHLSLGSGIIIPAHALHHFNASKQFKMISTTIKSGYEE
jgi:quercetin dioxygenase-like cupin family protein